jgi:hypothetical protein
MSDQTDLPPEFADIPRQLLKHGKGRFKDVILVPQPSDSPNDPLNVSSLTLRRPDRLVRPVPCDGKLTHSCV